MALRVGDAIVETERGYLGRTCTWRELCLLGTGAANMHGSLVGERQRVWHIRISVYLINILYVPISM